MELSSLAALGKIAGLGGIAIGAVVLLGRWVVDRTAGVPKAEQARLLRFIAAGAFSIGALGIVAWLVSGLSGGPTVTAGTGGMAGGRDVSGNTVTLELPQGGSALPPTAGSGITAAPGGVTGGRDVTGNKLTIRQPQGSDVPPHAANLGAKSP